MNEDTFASVRARDYSVDIFREAFLLLKGPKVQGILELPDCSMPDS